MLVFGGRVERVPLYIEVSESDTGHPPVVVSTPVSTESEWTVDRLPTTT